MIIYKFKRLIPIYKRRFLSEVFGKADPLENNRISLKWYLLLLILGPVVFISLFILFSIINFNIDWIKTTNDFFKSTITIPLAFVTVFIPVITLAISFITGKVPDSFVRIYFGHLEPKIIFKFGITYLAIFAFLLLLSYSRNINEFHSKILFIIGLTSLIAPIFLTSIFILRAMTLVTSEIPYKPIVSQMQKEIKCALDLEMGNNIFRYIFPLKCKEMGLILDTSFSSFDYKPIIANKSGTLIDIDLDKLKSFANSIENEIQHEDEKIKGIISVVPFIYPDKLEIVGYVSSSEKSVENKLNDALILAEDIKLVEKDLNSFKTLAYGSIENNQESEFNNVMNVYVEGLKYYMEFTKTRKEIGIASKRTELYEPFNKWRILNFIWHDLEDIIQLAAKSSNTSLIGNLSHKLLNLFILAIKYQDFSVLRMLDLYYIVYYFSFNNHNIVGIDRSVRYLGNIITNIEKLLKNPNITVNAFKDTSSLLYFAIKNLIDILKESIDNNDFETFKNALNMLSQILLYYYPDNIKLSQRKKKLTKILESLEIETNGKNKENIQKELSLIDSIQNIEIKKELYNEIMVQKFDAGSYIIKKINDGDFIAKDYEKYLKPLLLNIQDYKNLLDILELLEKRGNGKITFKLTKTVWERSKHPHTGKLFATNTVGRILLFFCIIGIYLAKEVGVDYRPLNSSEIINSKLGRIESICKMIKSEKEKWNLLIGPEFEEKTVKFINECKKAKKV